MEEIKEPTIQPIKLAEVKTSYYSYPQEGEINEAMVWPFGIEYYQTGVVFSKNGEFVMIDILAN